ncbi:MAG: cupin domain-containing protein [Marinifilaceae bacterium]|jgi:mannose-6-phosphate isomerase-like protein (cupin superfamily)|nr:cupin domain-containing protein [Marinifilaceae bacterium]
MKKTEELSTGNNYTAINIGNLDSVKDYSLIHPKLGTEIKGKLFLKELTKSTGTQISFTSIPAYSEIGYFHKHRKDEETYIFLKGEGKFQIDDDCFEVKEGSIVRVAPDAIRGLKNSMDDELVFICIQSKADSLEEHSTEDGYRCIVEDKDNLLTK